MLYPVVGALRVEIRLHKHEDWFKKVDTNKDSRIDVAELARCFANINKFKETPKLMEDLRKAY